MKHPLAYYLPNIERLYKAGKSLTQIAEKYGVTRERVRQVVAKCAWYNDESMPHKFKRMPKGAKCVLNDCGNPRKDSLTGYCDKHLKRWLAHGDPNLTLKPRNQGRTCTDCGERPAKSLDRCKRCYQNYRYRIDEDFRARRMKSSSKWTRKKLATDDEYRAKVYAYRNEWRRQRRSKQQTSTEAGRTAK